MADTKVTDLPDAGGATAADYLYIVDGATSKYVNFDDLEGSTTHDNLIAGTIASHDTGATGTELDTLTDGSDSDGLHAHATNDAARHAAITLNASATTGGMSLAAQEIANRAATNAQTGYATAAHITAVEANTAASHAESHSVASHNDTSGTGGELDTLTDGSNADLLHVHEGTAIDSTGEGGASKFLREDGDGTCSWQAPAGGGDALTTDPLSQFAATTSLQLIGVLSDETGTGLAVFNNTPTLITPILGTVTSGNISACTSTSLTMVTPVLGTPTSGVLTNCTGLPITGITSSTSAEFATLCSDETGSGLLVFGTSPTLVTPALGTPSACVLTNATALPAAQVAAGSLVAGVLATDHGAAATDMLINVAYGTGAAPAANTTTIGAFYATHEA